MSHFLQNERFFQQLCADSFIHVIDALYTLIYFVSSVICIFPLLLAQRLILFIFLSTISVPFPDILSFSLLNTSIALSALPLITLLPC